PRQVHGTHAAFADLAEQSVVAEPLPIVLGLWRSLRRDGADKRLDVLFDRGKRARQRLAAALLATDVIEKPRAPRPAIEEKDLLAKLRLAIKDPRMDRLERGAVLQI